MQHCKIIKWLNIKKYIYGRSLSKHILILINILTKYVLRR